MAVLVILGLAIGLQVITAIVVRRLIQVTRRPWIWVSLAAVVVLLTGWRCIIILRGVFAGVSAQPDLATEGLVLLISLCMVSGLAGIASLVLSIQRAQESARQTAEMALHAQQEAYETIFHAVPSEIRFKDTDNRLLRVNRTAAEAEGYTVADLEGKSLWQHYPAEIAAQEYASDLEVIKTGQPRRGVLTLQPTASGVLRWVQADKLPYRDRDGKITGIIECALDITERKQAEEALSMRIEQMRSVHTIAEEITRELDFVHAPPAHCATRRRLAGGSQERALSLGRRRRKRCAHRPGATPVSGSEISASSLVKALPAPWPSSARGSSSMMPRIRPTLTPCLSSSMDRRRRWPNRSCIATGSSGCSSSPTSSPDGSF